VRGLANALLTRRCRVELDSLHAATCTPTPRISRYVQGDDADDSGTQVSQPRRCCCTAVDGSFPAQIIVETNFRVYAYTTSYVDFQILSRFATVVEKFPDMCPPTCSHSSPPSLSHAAHDRRRNRQAVRIHVIRSRPPIPLPPPSLPLPSPPPFPCTRRLARRCNALGMAFDADISSELIIDYLILRCHPACASLK
jgi:hypothetical protein